MTTSIGRFLARSGRPLCASLVALVFQTLPALALPILPGNQHSHDRQSDVTWHHTGAPGGPINDPNTHLHQHWNARALNVNHGDGSFFAVAAWDNRGTTTTYHDILLGDNAFGHGFIANRVLYWFDPAFPAPNNAFIARVNQVFGEWVRLVHEAFADANRPDRRLGFNFRRAPGATAPAEPHITVRFRDLEDTTTGQWDFNDLSLEFNTADFVWYTGAAAPGAGNRDFMTTARHEIGHVIGLDHTFNGAKTVGHSIMGSGAAALGVRVAIDDGSIEGALALYTQVPSPATVVLVIIGLAMFIGRARRMSVFDA